MSAATVRIPLTRGMFATIDEADLPLVSNLKWRAGRSYRNRTWYAYATIGIETIRMHRLLMGCYRGDGVEVDHWNGNGLDNTRGNIRRATHADNQHNQAKTRGSSRFKGVSWYKAGCKWAAVIRLNRRDFHLGYFADELEAARVYNREAARMFGLYARLNEVTPSLAEASA